MDLFAQPRWWRMEALRALYTPEAMPLAHAFGPSAEAPEWAFFACDVKGARRSLAAFGSIRALVRYEYGERESLEVTGFPAPERIRELDLAGVRLGATVALFHRGTNRARSAVSFRVDAPGRLRYLVAGLAPGSWDVWFQGFREDSLTVQPREACLYFEGDPGGYFLRQF